MAERLTEFNKTGWVLKLDEPQNEFEARQQLMSKFKFACEKLGKIEDILEKYGVESVEEISKIFSYLSGRFINSVYSLKHKFDSYEDKIKYLANKKGQYYEELYETKQDRDTWKRACEFLAYKYAEEYFDGRDIEHCFNANKRDKFVKENINYFYQQAKTEGNDE